MQSDAFLIQDGKEFGPFSPSQLKQLADAGRIRPDDLIRKGKDGQPVQARNIAGLLDAFGTSGRQPPSLQQKPNPTTESSWVGEVLAPDDGAAPVPPVPKKIPPRVEKPIAASQAKPSWMTTERVPPNFDPYHIWLGIPKGKRPPTHYQLLRIGSNEHADEVIGAAAERQAEYVRKCRIGEYAKFADRLLYEIEEARLCLLNPQLRREYDEKVAEGKPATTKKRVLPPPGKPVGEGNEIATTYFKIVSILTAAFILMAVVSFMLPWKKVVFSKNKDQAEVANVAAPPAGNPAAPLPAGNAVNPAQQPKQLAMVGKARPPVAQPAALARNLLPPQVKLVELSELNEGRYSGYPWLSRDGLTIYWEATGIMTAHRRDQESAFQDKKLLFEGRHPTVTADGLEMVLLVGGVLHSASRKAVTEDFARPKPIAELKNQPHVKNPCLSPDGRKLYFNRQSGPDESEFVVANRSAQDGVWSSPQPISIQRAGLKPLTWIFISDDERMMFCCEERFTANAEGKGNLMIWTRDSPDLPFSEYRFIHFDEVGPIIGRSPRYVAATHELFFTRLTAPRQERLCVIKNFDPAQKPAKALDGGDLTQRKAVPVNGVPTTIDRDEKAFKEQVRDATRRAQKFLTGVQKNDGSFGGLGFENPRRNLYTTGVTSLAVFALLESGMSRDDPATARALDFLRTSPLPDSTYEVSTMLLALVSAHDWERDRTQIEHLAQKLKDCQTTKGKYAGTWNYGRGKLGGGHEDNCNTGFAIAGLHAATEAGVRIQTRTWQLTADHLVKCQNDDGGWGYHDRDRSTGSMACSGIASVLICSRHLTAVDADGKPQSADKKAAERSQAVKRGIDWLGEQFTVQENPGHRTAWVLFYLFEVARAGHLSGQQFFGPHDWHREEAGRLIEVQDRQNGNWNATITANANDWDKIVATSFGLLVLSGQ